MESLLWGLDLLAVLFLCRWALREDTSAPEAERKKPGQN
jgi:hypothetical protein